ncbi:MAG: histidine phosphatase family protein [Sulfurimonas sp.]|nr:histidine phosphatase family protein [Sulfurimonas sp.]MBU3938425.1 histidine phosphatase family protein [bacterium]MBU4025494.1 histidine phosphatase family protein [bacterium]MBU4059170.1 histidine phosphatase family protein [bacterium]MBU4111447.1 histidine phosphatase family protein [bacterium]
MKITLLRHAQVQDDFLGKYNGHNEIGLSKKGDEQALALADKYLNAGFDTVFCSDLLRAKETLAPFELQCKPIFSSALREKSWGRHEGKSFEQINAEGIEYLNFDYWVDALDGERVEDFRRRVENYFFKTIFKQDAQNILVVTHSGVIKMLLSLVQNITLEEAFATELPYASCVILDKIANTFVQVKP